MDPIPTEFPTPIDESRPVFRDLRFLVIDDNPDGRFLVSKTLLRKFPHAILTECQTADASFRVLAAERVSLIACHRTFEFDAVSLVRELRTRNATVPILMLSGIDRSQQAIAAGADAFLTYDEWLMVGNHVASLLSKITSRTQESTQSNPPANPRFPVGC